MRAVDVLVAHKFDPADFDLGSFFHHEGNAHCSRRDWAHFRADGCELVPVLGEQVLDHDFGFLDLVGSYWLSTERPTLSSLNRSRTSLFETELNPG